MASEARMTVRLEPTTRRKVERLASQAGISMNQALNRLLREAPDDREQPGRRRHYRLKPRKVGCGFDIGQARQLATEMADAATLMKLLGER